MENLKKYFAEAIGAFAIVFCGTGAIIIDQQTHGQVSHVGVAITFGLIVTAMIYAFGQKSGAHFNPAVTLAFSAAGLFPLRRVPIYIVAQCVGAILASAILKFLFPENQNLGSTIPVGSLQQSFVLEIILTFFLMLVILFTSQGSKETGTMAALAIGGVVLLEAMFAGPICGASMNPARSLGPALLSGGRGLSVLWLYWLAPMMGALGATVVWRVVR